MIYPEYNKPEINYCLLYQGMMWNVLFEVKFRIHVQIWLIVIIIGSVAVHVENQTFEYYNMYIKKKTGLYLQMVPNDQIFLEIT